MQRMFKRSFGQTPRSYVTARRLERVRATLREERDVTTAVYEAGFTAASRGPGSPPDAHVSRSVSAGSVRVARSAGWRQAARPRITSSAATVA
jgi:AraC-like DNA-binding protein